MKVRLGHRAVRSLWNGLGVLVTAFTGGHIACVAVNTIAESTVLHPVGIPLLLGSGMFLFGFGIEWSKDITATENEAEPPK